MADMMRWAGKPLQNPIIAPADQTAQVAQLNISPLNKEHKRIERKVRAEAKKLATQAKRKKAEEVPYEQAWQSADKRMRAGIEKDASKMYGDGLLSMGPEAHVMNASQLTETKMVNDLREHDLTKMCDDAWNNLGTKKQNALIAQYRNQLKAKYPKAPANEVERVARAYARQVSDQKMYDLAVQKKMPKSDLEFLAQRIAEGNSILMFTKGFARSKAGSVGTMQAEQEATQRYEKQGGFGRTVLGFAGDAVGLAADPVTLLSMGAGGLAVKATTALAGKVLAMNVGKAVAGAYMRAGGLVVKGINALAGKVLPNVFGKTVARAYMRSGGLKLKGINALADKMLVGMVEGGANFGTYQAAKEAIGQYQMGGHINPKTGENEGYSIEEVRKSALHGAKMGAAIGWLSPVGKTLSTRLARATKSTVGKVGIRSAEYVVTPLAEGTIFSIPEWIEGGRDKMDVWTNYVAMAFVFKGPRALKTGKAVIGDMFSYKNAQSRMERLRGFETRLRARADGGAGLTLTKDEEKELMNAGYGNLVELVKDAENTEKHNTGHIIDEQGRTVHDNTSLSKHGEGYDVVKSKLQEMIEDTTISEASRSKMYYYATGRKLQMSTVMGSSMTKNPDGTFTVRSEGFNGVITSRTFKSKKQAENEVDKIDRLVELNSVEIGERYKGAEAEQRKLLDACTNVGRQLQADPVMLMRAYRKAKNRNAEELSETEHEMVERIDEALKNSTLDVETPEAIRTEIAEKHGVDVDSAISKRRIRRTEAEQKAVDEYVQRLFPEQKEAKNKTRTPQERHEELLMSVDENREQGYNTENSDKATVRHEMQQSRENLVKAMGEEIATLADNGDYQGILNILYDSELSQEQNQALDDYVNAKARYDGMIERVHDNIDDAVKESDRQIDARTNEQSGMLHRAQMQDGRVVYITHGNVVMADDGKAVDPFRSDKSVIVVDAETGKSEFTSSSAIFKVEDPVSATEAKETAGATIEDAIATQEGDLIDGTLQFKQGDRYALLDDNGQKHTVQVVQADENIVQVILDGKQATEDGKPIVMPKELLQRWSDAETMLRAQQVEQEQAPVEAETKEEAETEPKQAETEQAEEKPTAPQAEQQPTADVATEPQAENAIAEAEQAQPTAEVEQAQSDAMPMVDDAKGKPTEEPDWGKATPQRAHEYIYNKQESELDTEEANAFVENMIAEKQNAVKKIEGKKPKIGTSIADYKRKQAEWQENLQTAQAEMDYWNSIKQIHDEALLKAKQERKQATDKQGNQEKQGGEQDAPVEEPAETGAGTEGDTGKATDVPSAGGDGVRQAHEEVGLSDDEATAFLSKMEDAAEEMPQLELTPENWHEQFGEDGVLTTPIGKVKMGANQIAKLFEKGRSNQFGMIKPTLENPNVIIEVPSSSIDGTEERYSSYLFVKTFTGSDGRKIYYFKSVTVKKDGMEVSVSSHYDRPKRILDALKKGKLLYRFDGGAQTEHRPADVSVTTSPVVQGKQRSSTFTDANRENTTPISDLSETSSEDKGSKSSSKSKEKTEKGAETHEEKQGAGLEKFTPTPQKEGESGKTGSQKENQQKSGNQKKNNVLNNTTDTDKTQIGNENDKATLENATFSAGKETQSSAIKQVNENKSTKLARLQSTGERFEGISAEQGRATAKVEETHRKRNEIKNRIKKLLGSDKREDYERADEGTKAEVDNLLAEYNGLADNISEEDLLLANRYAIEMLNDDSLGVRDQGASLQNRIQVFYSLKHPHGLLPVTKAANDSKLARLQSTDERADEGTQSEDAFVSKEKVRKAIDAYEDALHKFNNSRDKLWKEKKSIPSDTREREELNRTKQELQDVLLQLNTKELSDLLKQVSVKDTENVIENVLDVVNRQEQRLMAFNALLDKQGHITPEYKEDKKAISVSEFVETDKERSKIYIMLTGVFHDKGYVVGCDSYLLLARKEDYDKSLEGKVTNKKGEVLDGKYPDWRAAVSGEQGKSWGVNLEELHAFTRGVLSKLRAEKANPSTKKDAKIAFKTADGKIVQCYANALDKALRGAKSIGAKSFFGKGNGFAITQTPKGYVVCPMLYPHQNIDDNSFAYVPRVSGLHHSTETLSNATEATRQPSQAEGTAQAGTAGKGREAGEVAKPATDKQGNPLNADGSLKVDKIGAVEELTDGDFSAPTRNVQLPTLPNNVDKAIGANGKSVVIKKNIFEKNGKHHKDLTPEDSRNILSRVLYSPDLYGNNQKETRPYNWILVNLGEGGKHKAVILEVSNNKEHVEIVNWHYLDEKTLNRKKKQAVKEGGLILELSTDSSAADTFNDLSVGKDSKAFQENQEAGQEKFTPTPQKEGESVMDYAERVAGEHQAHVTRKKEEAKVNTNPTDAQKEAGNYRKGHIKIDGMDVTIEQPKGSVRRGTDADGKAWESKMHNTYGYIRGTQSVDGDHIDIFLSDNPESGNVYVVDQVNTDGTFDEHKVMYGFPDMESARKAYLSNYKDGWQGLGNITEVSKEEFKKWINGSKRKTKPFAEYSSVKTEGDVKVEHPIESSDGTETHQGGTEAESNQSNQKSSKKGNYSKYVLEEDAERFEELRRRLKKKLGGQLNLGIDPEVFAMGVEMSYLMLKKGARVFKEYAHGMIDALGDEVRPYLKSFYNGARDLPEMEDVASDLTAYEEVRKFDVATIGKESVINEPSIFDTAEQISKESKVEKNIEQEAKNTTESEDVDTPSYSITKQHNNKKDIDIWVVRGKERVERDAFLQQKQVAKDNNGYYSSFKGVNGFVFNTPEEAQAFANNAFSKADAAEVVAEKTQHTDNQGNPINEQGKLIVEKIESIDDLTDADFEQPTRSVELPTIPKNIDDAIGANGKPVVIKKNIFEKNKQSHSDLTPAQSRDILQSALYNADLYGQNQKARRPYNWIVINTKDNTGNNRLVLLEVNDKKDNVEIIHWHYIREAALETIKRQARR